ncbi:KTSC domain-containing protein [Devosia sp. SD17-2]|uniref:KTSC domain-containing protein n=1 Tax=Devosia sp. SD17-2 TaxID=2976459 RepID=UPI0023D8253E|nr:KTSC domain-containing protein [Devosia sp. SD17-2]WEJ32367.1 KTSC domain-containing protein [Devosia sp. SD17-2]
MHLAPEGRRYKYFDVPPSAYEALRDAPSRGQYFNRAIKGHYRCTKIEAESSRTRRRRLGAAPS